MVLSNVDVARADALAREGQSVRSIAETIGVAKSTIKDALRRFRETGSYERRAGSGRPRATTEVDDRFITLSVLRDRHLIAPEVWDRLQVARNTRVSSDTVRRS
uniref:Paired domain-containing protein n=1 Tax=Rhodnius prolixus TaxID=13249 RepID=T1HTL2_RHOPR